MKIENCWKTVIWRAAERDFLIVVEMAFVEKGNRYYE